jgi:hypothetical protein
MVMKRATKGDRDLPTLRDLHNHGKKALTEDEAAAFKMWTMLYKKYESMKENFNVEDVDTALIYFDLNPKAGPKIGISRRDRLARHRLLGIDVPEDIVRMIEDVDWVGEYLYSERPPYYMSRLIDAAAVEPF